MKQVEAELKCCPLVDNIFAYADPLYDYIVAFIVVNRPALLNLVSGQLNGTLANKSDMSNICAMPLVTFKVLEELTNFATSTGLQKRETPQKVKLIADAWTPDSGLVTPAFKIRRRKLVAFYSKEIE